MKLAGLGAALFALGAFCNNEIPMQLPHTERANKLRAELSKRIIVDKENPPIHTKKWNWPICKFFSWWLDGCHFDGVTFIEKRSFRQQDLKTEVFIRREVIQRVTNFAEESSSVHRSKTTVRFNQNTLGWTGGAQLQLYNALSISGSVAYHSTKGTQVMETEAATFPCPARTRCWSELWIPHVRLSGSCYIRPSTVCGRFKGNPCTYDEYGYWVNNTGRMVRLDIRWYHGMPFIGGKCNIDDWTDAVCLTNTSDKERRETPRLDENCQVTFSVMEGSRPYTEDHWFTSPLDPPPKITGYLAGVYLLGSKDLIYDPHRSRDRYRSNDQWYTIPGYPKLDISKWKHKQPVALRVQKKTEYGTCYQLDTEEFFCPDAPGEAKYFTDRKRYYAKPKEAPEPSIPQYWENL
ncbi:hypothetical protein CDD83_4142 [Cordyceps sp. RAO-2017]|nr:hypothetical protein CDD83_4142 [Cordyceps sp. RAO-2017]